MANKKKSTQKSPRKFNFSLSIPGIVFASVFLVLVLVWAFILGVIVGRGYHPRSIISSGQNRVAARQDKNKTIASRENKVLKAEELGFYDSLQDKMDSDSFSGRNNPVKSRTANRVAQDRERAGRKKKDSSSRAGISSRRYLYKFQVAAFRDKDKADDLRIRINRAGLDTIIKKVHKDKKIWYRLFVTFKGRPKETRSLKKRLKDLGFDNFFLQNKEPLER